MKMFPCILAAVWLPLLSAAGAGPLHSFRPGAVWPDDHGVAINAHGGGILLHQGVYYWFGEHKVAGGAGNSAQVGVHVYSSTDLYNWKDEGIALAVSSDPASEITEGCILERPKVIFNAKTGKFVMWFHLELKGKGYGAALAGVAVADRPTGPYRYLGSSRLPDDQMSRDMTLFVDDDHTAYQVAASEDNRTIHITQLTDDYLKATNRVARVFPNGYNEGPALFKHAGKYYLITSGCSGWTPNAARSAEADSIWGPWKALGNPCLGSPRQVSRTFGGQSTYVLPVPGRPDAFIFMADQWHPWNAIDGRYVWLPIEWRDGRPRVEWKAEWDLSAFDLMD